MHAGTPPSRTCAQRTGRRWPGSSPRRQLMHSGGLRHAFARLELDAIQRFEQCSIWRANALTPPVMALTPSPSMAGTPTATPQSKAKAKAPPVGLWLDEGFEGRPVTIQDAGEQQSITVPNVNDGRSRTQSRSSRLWQPSTGDVRRKASGEEVTPVVPPSRRPHKSLGVRSSRLPPAPAHLQSPSSGTPGWGPWPRRPPRQKRVVPLTFWLGRGRRPWRLLGRSAG